jgi:ribosome-associated protein
MIPQELLNLVVHDLSDLKAINVSPLDVRTLTTLTDYMVIATGNSSRHVHALCHHLVNTLKERHLEPVSIQGDRDDEWILVDLGDVVIHLMQPRTRDFYNLEKLWNPSLDMKEVVNA